uniref:Integral membrane protein TerC n=1 Tax=Rhabditophanes sp. KR3021 TaxID=114890 RepID=A0AC35U880_9BILA
MVRVALEEGFEDVAYEINAVLDIITLFVILYIGQLNAAIVMEAHGFVILMIVFILKYVSPEIFHIIFAR